MVMFIVYVNFVTKKVNVSLNINSNVFKLQFILYKILASSSPTLHSRYRLKAHPIRL